MLPFRYTILMGSVPKDLVVQKADFDTRPAHSVFRLEFPEPIKIVDVGRKLVYQPQKVWDLSDLPGRTSPNAKPIDIPDTFTAAPQHPGELQPKSRWVTGLIVVGVVLLGLGAIVVWRRRNGLS